MSIFEFSVWVKNENWEDKEYKYWEPRETERMNRTKDQET
jgi:hypothetical protein